MIRTLTLSTILLLACMPYSELCAQGCVAIRGSASCGSSSGGGGILSAGEFQAGVGFRYFESFRHFRGSEEETHRVEEGTEVINDSYFLDLSLSYGLSERLFATLVLPFVYHDRSSMYEHGGNPPNGLGQRNETSSSGLSDVRVSMGYWLFDPLEHNDFNVSAALGLKLATGSYDYTDEFYNQGENRDQTVETVVDQSIQPGDGGTGVTLDMQGYYGLTEDFLLSANLFYLFNFQETNGVATRNGSSEFSCPDQFAARVGGYYMTPLHGISAYAGGRIEGVPSHDLFGSSAGYRRPGYAISVEPGISYDASALSLSLSVPIALYRNRTQSYEDEQRTEETGVYRHGDAAFADYLINFNVSYRFGGAHAIME